jgi:3-phosphoshikimate 1-carboxyvinyltransferase
VPGSKSLTNRFAVLAALARGTSIIRGGLRSDDTDRLFAALETLGVGVRRDGDSTIVTGCDARFPRGGRVDLGDGGTPTRFVIALASLAAEPVIVDEARAWRERPVDEGIELLRSSARRSTASDCR